MGLLDSLKGLGRAATDVFTGAITTLGPAFVEAGAQRLFDVTFGGGGRRQVQPVFPIVGGRTTPLPPLAPIVAPRSTPFPRQFPVGLPTVLPGGVPVSQFPIDRTAGVTSPFLQVRGGNGAADFFDIPGIDLRLPFTLEDGVCPTIFRPSNQATLRAVHEFDVTHPQTGRCITYRNMGVSILRRGDIQAAKKVRRVARMAGVRRPR